MNMGGDNTSCPYKEPTPTFSTFSHPHTMITSPKHGSRQNVYVLPQNINPSNHLHTRSHVPARTHAFLISSSLGGKPSVATPVTSPQTLHHSQLRFWERKTVWLQKLSAQSLWPSWATGRSGSWFSGE